MIVEQASNSDAYKQVEKFLRLPPLITACIEIGAIRGPSLIPQGLIRYTNAGAVCGQL